jgi:hypothetical protein
MRKPLVEQRRSRVVARSAPRVLDLAAIRPPDEVALILGMAIEEVEDILERFAPAGGTRRWQLRCDRTGTVHEARSQRAAYRLAQMLGLTEWSWRPAGSEAWL